MRRKRIKSYFGEEIHTISFSHMTEAKELLAEKSAEKEEVAENVTISGRTFSRSQPVANQGHPNYDTSKLESETKSISYPTSVELCKDYITLYCHWQVGNFADRIRKLFEYHFVKEMHDYFEQSVFLNKIYPILQQLMSTERITEQELIENSTEIRAREELERRKECAAVYDSMLKEMAKLGRKITEMGNYGKFIIR